MKRIILLSIFLFGLSFFMFSQDDDNAQEKSSPVITITESRNSRAITESRYSRVRVDSLRSHSFTSRYNAAIKPARIIKKADNLRFTEKERDFSLLSFAPNPTVDYKIRTVKPDPAVDYKLRVAKPDPSVDYKLRVTGSNPVYRPDRNR